MTASRRSNQTSSSIRWIASFARNDGINTPLSKKDLTHGFHYKASSSTEPDDVGTAARFRRGAYEASPGFVVDTKLEATPYRDVCERLGRARDPGCLRPTRTAAWSTHRHERLKQHSASCAGVCREHDDRFVWITDCCRTTSTLYRRPDD